MAVTPPAPAGCLHYSFQGETEGQGGRECFCKAAFSFGILAGLLGLRSSGLRVKKRWHPDHHSGEQELIAGPQRTPFSDLRIRRVSAELPWPTSVLLP